MTQRTDMEGKMVKAVVREFCGKCWPCRVGRGGLCENPTVVREVYIPDPAALTKAQGGAS